MPLRLLSPAVSKCLSITTWYRAGACVVLLLACCASQGWAQSTSAAVNGRVTDPAGRIVPGTEVEVVNIDTNVVYPSKTNGSGLYNVSGLTPGRYRLMVRKDGFKVVNKTDITLNVQDILEENIALEVGSTSESVTVDGSGVTMNTTDASVSTVVDQKFVENMPLNGRSIQSLISLAPGVVQTPTFGANADTSGEFSVNGQRTESNYYTVDGVSANVGSYVSGVFNGGGAGLTPSQTALGTTQSMVSVDALQEFRIDTSTYSAEYGRTPGGHISLQTRSGTDHLHGTLFDYARNGALDANNWFNNHNGFVKTAENQNDYGGTLSGPIFNPHVYNGLNKSFFFYSYEGVNLTVPTPAIQTEVPDANLRSTAAPQLQAAVNAFPVANGAEVPGATNLAFFTGAYSLPAGLNTNSIRIDQKISNRDSIFARYSDSSSFSQNRSASQLSELNTLHYVDRSITTGLTHTFSSSAVNEARYNYTWTSNNANQKIDSFGGAIPQTTASLLPNGDPNTEFIYIVSSGVSPSYVTENATANETQVNVTDTQQFLKGHHLFKAGVDYRRIELSSNFQDSLVEVIATPGQIQSNAAGTVVVVGTAPQVPIFHGFSAFAEDEWKIFPRTTLSYGVRWDLSPPPTNGSGMAPPVLNQVDNLATATLAPAGTPLWNTDWLGFAPRLGLATQLNNRAGHETVLRIGIGNFFDSGSLLAADAFAAVGFNSTKVSSGQAFPLSATFLTPSPFSIAAPYNAPVIGYDRNTRLPYTLEWNVSMEQAFGASRTVTLGYVGSAARRMVNSFFAYPPASNTAFSGGNGADIFKSNGYSNYDSLQTQFQQKLSHGVRVLASYTWSHCIDNESSGYQNYYSLLKGDCNFDIRNNFQIATSYDAPKWDANEFSRAVTGGWSFDVRAFSRSSAPVDIYGTRYNGSNGARVYSQPNLVPGKPLYIYAIQR